MLLAQDKGFYWEELSYFYFTGVLLKLQKTIFLNLFYNPMPPNTTMTTDECKTVCANSKTDYVCNISSVYMYILTNKRKRSQLSLDCRLKYKTDVYFVFVFLQQMMTRDPPHHVFNFHLVSLTCPCQYQMASG